MPSEQRGERRIIVLYYAVVVAPGERETKIVLYDGRSRLNSSTVFFIVLNPKTRALKLVVVVNM